MHKVRFTLPPELTLEAIAAYQDDVIASLHLYFSPTSPTFVVRFAGLSLREVALELESRLVESDTRSALAVMTSLEAHFLTDYNERCRRRLKDDLSLYFRHIDKVRQGRARLDEEILEGWKKHTNVPAILISQLRSAFKFRHWLAHGRYWLPKLGRKYDFEGVYLMAVAVISAFPFTI